METRRKPAPDQSARIVSGRGAGGGCRPAARERDRKTGPPLEPHAERRDRGGVSRRAAPFAGPRDGAGLGRGRHRRAVDALGRGARRRPLDGRDPWRRGLGADRHDLRRGGYEPPRERRRHRDAEPPHRLHARGPPRRAAGRAGDLLPRHPECGLRPRRSGGRRRGDARRDGGGRLHVQAARAGLMARGRPDPVQVVKERRDAALAALVGAMPYAQRLGVCFDRRGDELTAILPFDDRLVGNPLLPALHGGATAAFLEIASIVELAWSGLWDEIESGRLSIADLGAGRLPRLPRDAYARARVNRSGRRYASVHVEAWQDNRARPFAQATGHFLMPPDPTLPDD